MLEPAKGLAKQIGINAAKKELYKQKPIANILFIRKGVAYYTTTIKFEGQTYAIRFEVPVDDMGDADYYPEMDGKLLVRYISE